MADPLAAVVLAAGQGTRMRSKKPKVLHTVAGEPMLKHVLNALVPLAPQRLVVVVGHGAEAVRSAIANDAVSWVTQEPQLGTGHAVLQAREVLNEWPSDILVLYGDTPLLRTETLAALLHQHRRSVATLTMLTAIAADPGSYGRIVRDEHDRVLAIVEERAATPAQRAIREVNSGVYCFRGPWLWRHLDRLRFTEKGEYYLTDLVAMAIGEGLAAGALVASDPTEALGINTRLQLAEAEAALRTRVRQRLMMSGVTMLDPDTTYVDAAARIGRDTIVYPNCLIEGLTSIGEDCVIGPNCRLVNARIGHNCRVNASVIEHSAIGDGVSVGPFAHLRGGAQVGHGAEIGNYAEIKKSTIGAGTKMHHFSYLGDAEVGERVNVGAGSITCNFDSETKTKNKTIIEDDAALGSDTMLVAPVRVGRRATTGAGAVVTRDIPPDTVAAGVPAKVLRRVRTKES